MKILRTAVVGVGHLGRQHARIHAALAAEGKSEFVAACDTNEETARAVAEERGVDARVLPAQMPDADDGCAKSFHGRLDEN